jgi:hypothetical protein
MELIVACFKVLFQHSLKRPDEARQFSAESAGLQPEVWTMDFPNTKQKV